MSKRQEVNVYMSVHIKLPPVPQNSKMPFLNCKQTIAKFIKIITMLEKHQGPKKQASTLVCFLPGILNWKAFQL